MRRTYKFDCNASHCPMIKEDGAPEFPFKCPIPGCGQTFQNQADVDADDVDDYRQFGLEHGGRKHGCAPIFNLNFLFGKNYDTGIVPCILHILLRAVGFILNHGIYAEIERQPIEPGVIAAHQRSAKMLKALNDLVSNKTAVRFGKGVLVPKERPRMSPHGDECWTWLEHFDRALAVVFPIAGLSSQERAAINKRRDRVKSSFSSLKALLEEICTKPIDFASDDAPTRARVRKDWGDRVEEKSEAYVSSLVDMCTRTEVNNSPYAAVILDQLPRAVRIYGDVTVFSTEAQEALNKEFKDIVRSRVCFSNVQMNVPAQVLSEGMRARGVENTGAVRPKRKSTQKKAPGKVERDERKRLKKETSL